MIESLLNSTSIPLLERVAAFSERRQEVLAGNIANIDTPDYRMRDLPVDEFQAALARVIHQIRHQQSRQQTYAAGNSLMTEMSIPDRPASLDSTTYVSTNPISQLKNSTLYQAHEAQPENVLFHDRNNRSIEHQTMEMTKNSMMQRMAIELMMAQTRTLESVISERV